MKTKSRTKTKSKAVDIDTADGIREIPMPTEQEQLVAWVLLRTGYAQQHNPSDPELYATNAAETLVKEWEDYDAYTG